jgi:polar amino acid transport system substrate-binding protein
MNTTLKQAGILSAAAIAFTFSISACGTPAATSSANCTPKHAGVQTVDPGKLTVGVIDLPPFSSYNSGNPSGIDISIVSKLAQDECLELSYQQASYADAIQSISGGSLDLATGSIAVTEKRMKAIDYTASLYVEGTGITTKTGAKTVADVEKMSGKVGTVDGYMTSPPLAKIFGDRLVSYPSTVELKSDFDAGRLVASFETYAVAAIQFKDVERVTVSLIEEEPSERMGALAVPAEDAFPITKGNTSLQTALSDGIKAQHEDGTIAKLLTDVGLSGDLAKVGSEQYAVPAS